MKQRYICCAYISTNSKIYDILQKACLFFLFQLDQPEVGSESEPKKSYRSSRAIGFLLSCICRAVSSCWSSASLAVSSVILELACTNFSSAFWWWSDFLVTLQGSSPAVFVIFWLHCCISLRITEQVLSLCPDQVVHPLWQIHNWGTYPQ